MGFFSWLWEWIKNLSFRGTRDREEDREERDAKKEIALTEKEKEDEREESSIEDKIMEELKKIRNELSPAELSVEITVGRQAIAIEKAFLVLTMSMQRLIHTNTSIKAEEKTLQRIVDYWRVVRRGLMGQAIRRGVSRVNLLFKKLGIILGEEDRISYQKIRLVKEQYELIMQEEGTEAERPV